MEAIKAQINGSIVPQYMLSVYQCQTPSELRDATQCLVQQLQQLTQDAVPQQPNYRLSEEYNQILEPQDTCFPSVITSTQLTSIMHNLDDLCFNFGFANGSMSTLGSSNSVMTKSLIKGNPVKIHVHHKAATLLGFKIFTDQNQFLEVLGDDACYAEYKEILLSPGEKVVGFKSRKYSEHWPSTHYDFQFIIL